MLNACVNVVRHGLILMLHNRLSFWLFRLWLDFFHCCQVGLSYEQQVWQGPVWMDKLADLLKRAVWFWWHVTLETLENTPWRNWDCGSISSRQI